MRFAVLVLLSILLVVPALAQSRPAPKPAVRVLPSARASVYAQSYAARVNALNAQMQPILTATLRDYEAMQATLTPSVRRRRSDEENAQAQSAAKGTLLDNVARLRPLARKLRNIGPVPRSLKRADEDFTDASFEFDQAINTLVIYANAPSNEAEGRASKLLRRALTSLDAGMIKMSRAIDAGVRGKTYVEG